MKDKPLLVTVLSPAIGVSQEVLTVATSVPLPLLLADGI